MKVQHVLTFVVITLAVMMTSRLPETFAEPASADTGQSNRMIDLLSEGSVVQLDSENFAYDVILLSDEQVQEFRDQVKRTEEELRSEEHTSELQSP